jgi:cysteine desulfurase
MRGGTENVYGIIGMAKALEIAYANMEKETAYILGLKKRLIEQLQSKISDVAFNGDCLNLDKSLYTVLNAAMPKHEISEMLLFNLDIKKISVSGGSACSSGTDIGSHVLRFLNADHERGHVRFSFSKYNTTAEVDYVVDTLEKMFKG